MKMSEYAADRDDEDQIYEGPDQDPVEPAVAFITLIAEACSLVLFLGMLALWSALGSGA